MPTLNRTHEDRVRMFKAKLSQTADGCWMWTGNKNHDGYGSLKLYANSTYRMTTTHRYAWELFVGPIPERMCVLHKCDKPACCNPDHLWLGTQLQNVRDMHSKGRTARGYRHIRRDAERYRWLRENYTGALELAQALNHFDGPALDAAIDAALAERPKFTSDSADPLFNGLPSRWDNDKP